MTKTALITGSSVGIGYELAKIHAKNGGDLVIIARRKELLNDLKHELEEKYKVKVYAIGKDLSQPGAAGEVYNELKRERISVDYLINNAGFGDFGLFAESDWIKQEKMINLNVTALTHFTHLFLPDMIQKGSGKIMNLASTAAFQPGPTMSVYFASKAYVLSFSEAINYEVRDKGITVTALCPGSTDTSFHNIAIDYRKKLKERSLISSGAVAEYGYRAMLNGTAVAIPGIKNAIMASMVRFFPRKIILKAVRRIQEKKF